MLGNEFNRGFFGAVVSNVIVTDFNTLKRNDGTLVVDPVQRQFLPASLGVAALIYGLTAKNDDSKRSMALGFALGSFVMQAARYFTGCYDVQGDDCMRARLF